MKRALGGLLWLAGLAYPFVVYFSLGKVAVAWLLLPLALLWLLRSLLDQSATGLLARALPFGMAAFCLSVAIWDALAFDATFALRAYPVLVNAMLLGVFAHSLTSGMPVIERLARLRHADLPAEGVRYTRQLTKLWCAFFAANGSIAALLAVFGSLESWTLYNGLISYLLIGALCLGEWCFRPAQGKRV
ncbi:hypothetical protein AXE65_05240 [Ventosimonas gracilis]|uniref:DNA gyrase subunit B n=1 Tax=Ventosimonas gracilis TaxID=1680762 RepID=A0A139SP23_9GAMM|nr:hypothetical protein [Ventosimonas gracilis]KXU36293.1 hypothetical protein AXE65_05240 [Ventosimonas gracilis]